MHLLLFISFVIIKVLVPCVVHHTLLEMLSSL